MANVQNSCSCTMAIFPAQSSSFWAEKWLCQKLKYYDLMIRFIETMILNLSKTKNHDPKSTIEHLLVLASDVMQLIFERWIFHESVFSTSFSFFLFVLFCFLLLLFLGKRVTSDFSLHPYIFKFISCKNCFYRVSFMGWLLYNGLFVKTPSVGIYLNFENLFALSNHLMRLCYLCFTWNLK